MAMEVCAYCKTSSTDLREIDFELLVMMREKDKSFTRTSPFCATCRGRMEAKWQRRNIKQRQNTTVSNSTTSSDAILGHGTSSESISETLSSSLRTTRSGGQRAGPSRNVAESRSDVSSSDIFSMENNVSQSSDSSEGWPIQSANISRQQVHDSPAANSSSSSMQVAPLPRNPTQRTQKLNRPLTPERLRNMTAEERSLEFQRYNRGTAG